MKKCLFCLLFLSKLTFGHAQYEKILNDPDVIWAGEMTATFVIEPEFMPGNWENFNFSTPLKSVGKMKNPPDDKAVLLADKLFEMCFSEKTPVFASPDSIRPLTATEKSERWKGLTGEGDSITVYDVETLRPSNQAIHEYVDAYAIQRVNVRQLLFYRKSRDEFDVYTLAFAPVFLKNFSVCDSCGYLYSPFWFKMPPFSKKQHAKKMDLDDPKITWARRLKTRSFLPGLDSLWYWKVFKNFEQPIVQRLIDRVLKDAQYEIHESLDWKPITGAARRDLFFSTDTVVTFDPETYEEQLKVIKNERRGEELMQLDLQQDWFWDDRRKQLIIKLNAFAPLLKVTDDEGNFRYSRPLFWREVKN